MQKTLRLDWSEEARADLSAIVDYISDENPQAAQNLKDEIEAKVNALPAHPKIRPEQTCFWLSAIDCAQQLLRVLPPVEREGAAGH